MKHHRGHPAPGDRARGARYSLLLTVALYCGLLLLLSGCISVLSGVDGLAVAITPVTISRTALPTATPTPLTDAQLALALARSLTLDQKLGQMVISEFSGATLTSDDIQMIKNDGISGVLIENKNSNAQSRAQLIALNKALQGQASIPLFISTDFEGGPVNELRQILGERDSESTIGATGDPNVAYQAGKSAANDLKALGLNVNYMPIVDVLTNANNPGLVNRTYGSDAQLVTKMGQAYLKGLSEGGIIGSLKHFPGLGSATADPHKTLPYMDRSLATMNAVDLVPYRTMIATGLVPMVMVTHINNPQLDPTLPTSLSPKVVTDLLRKQLGFKGVIISDTLWMGGVSNTYDLSKAAVLAINAGENLLLGPRTLAETISMLSGMKAAVNNGTISADKITSSVQLILQLKMQYKILSRVQALRLLSKNTGTPVAENGMGGVMAMGMVGDVKRVGYQ